MAKTTITQITDDLDGSAGANTIEFSYKGLSYTIDLAEKNEAKFDKAIDPFVAAATQIKQRPSSRRSSSSSSSKRDFAAIRDWAKSQDLEVSGRGRIPKNIVEQYDAAH
jgi:hypothetical protein